MFKAGKHAMDGIKNKLERVNPEAAVGFTLSECIKGTSTVNRRIARKQELDRCHFTFYFTDMLASEMHVALWIFSMAVLMVFKLYTSSLLVVY